MSHARAAHRWPLLVLLLLLLALSPHAAHAQDEERSLFWERLDVEITVLPDGSFHVVEHNFINFTNGTFRFGARTIPIDRTTGMSDITVEVDGEPLIPRSSGEAPGTYRVTQSDDNVDIRYFFAEPTTGQHTIRIGYLVEGGLRYYQGGDQLHWKAVHSDRPATVEESLVTVHLPDGVIRSQMRAETNLSDVDIAVTPDGRTVTFRANESLSPGDEMEIRVQFPHGVVSGVAPPWQAEADRADAEQAVLDERGRVIDLIAGIFSLLLLVGGSLGIFLLWFARGRDQAVGLSADYLSEPPDDLPAGLLGTLLDEQADLKDVMATLLDLARKGALRIQETAPAETGKSAEFTYELIDRERATTKAERTLIHEFFGNETTRDLEALRNKFYTALPKIKEALYEDVVQAGLFLENPQATRNRYRGWGIVLLLSTFALLCGGFWSLPFLNSAVLFFCVPFIVGFLGVLLMIIAQAMPRKSARGSEAASRWQAFRRYLQNIDRYGDLEEKREIWADYIPFAVAFGLEQGYLQKFSKVSAPAPRWYAPYGYGYGYGYPYGGYASHSASSMGGSVGGGMGSPTVGDSAPSAGGPGGVQGMSDAMAGGIQGMSTSLTSLISSTTRTLTSTPAPPPSSSSGGSSWSGGGGGGWSGGGGGGGGGGSSSFG